MCVFAAWKASYNSIEVALRCETPKQNRRVDKCSILCFLLYNCVSNVLINHTLDCCQSKLLCVCVSAVLCFLGGIVYVCSMCADEDVFLICCVLYYCVRVLTLSVLNFLGLDNFPLYSDTGNCWSIVKKKESY